MSRVPPGRYAPELDGDERPPGLGARAHPRPGDRAVLALVRAPRALRASGAVGIWHETYQVRAGEYEGIHSGIPRLGLAAAGRHVPIGSAGLSAGRRIGVRDHDVPTPA